MLNEGEGRSFGELALIREDCTRTASIITDEDIDLIVISRELYNRSLAKVLANSQCSTDQTQLCGRGCVQLTNVIKIIRKF